MCTIERTPLLIIGPVALNSGSADALNPSDTPTSMIENAEVASMVSLWN